VTNDAGVEFSKGGDIVIAIDEQPVRRFEDLVSYLVTRAAPGQTVTLTVLRDGAEQEIAVALTERPSQPVAASSEAPRDGINARAAIAIAEAAVKESGDLTGEITEKMAMPEERDGKSVWVVELATADDAATVVVDAESGDVVEITVE
jgi:PDZ domain-containing secreted protein